jgi:predicted membrane metal-binding protein
MAALAAATFYLVLSGAEVATQRSYIMTDGANAKQLNHNMKI